MPTEPVEGKDGKAGFETVAVPDVAQVPPVEGSPKKTDAPAEKKSMVRWIILAVVVVLLIIGAVFALRFMNRGLPEGLIQANGRIEGDRVSVAGKFPGRIAELLVREGDSVTPGQVLATFDDAQAKARVMQARAAVAALAAQLRAAETSLEVLKQDVQLGIAIAGAGVDNANAVLDKATAAKQQAAHDARRYRELLASDTIDKHRSEIANLAASASGSEQEAAGTGLTRAEKQLDQAELGDERVRAKNDELAALAAQLAQGHAVLTEAESVLDDMTLHAPSGGVITTRVRDKGEVVAAGSPLFDLVDLDRLYLKVYVPESQIGMLRLSLPALVYTDAFPDKPFPATARYIASRAEFTPKEVQTPDERVKLVYAVKLYLDENPDHSLTPGLPADAVIRWQDDVEWQKPKW
jgi:HlyD family secretion protein